MNAMPSPITILSFRPQGTFTFPDKDSPQSPDSRTSPSHETTCRTLSTFPCIQGKILTKDFGHYFQTTRASSCQFSQHIVLVNLFQSMVSQTDHSQNCSIAPKIWEPWKNMLCWSQVCDERKLPNGRSWLEISMGMVLPMPVGRQERMWCLSSSSTTAAVMSACNCHIFYAILSATKS